MVGKRARTPSTIVSMEKHSLDALAASRAIDFVNAFQGLHRLVDAR